MCTPRIGWKTLVKKYHDVIFGAVDVDDLPEVAEECGVQCMPTFLFYKNKEKAQFDKLLAESGEKLVVFKFTAKWCGPCKMIQPFFEELASEHRDVIFCIVDVDDCSDICEISSLPTFMFFKNRNEVDRFFGASKQKLKEHVERLK
uniref:Thioredoxin domain-containing protein n=1 Tax=Eptatretus burgeri TaxID=7764 RepID=A0A8C4R129_EPTBU